MISLFLKQRFGEPVHVSHSSAAEPCFTSKQWLRFASLTSASQHALCPVFVLLDDVQLEPGRGADTTLKLPHAPFVTCSVHAMWPVSLLALSYSATLHVSLASCHQSNLKWAIPSDKIT